GAVAGLATAPLAVAGGSAVIAGATWVWGSERRPANALELLEAFLLVDWLGDRLEAGARDADD
ncbi:MAG: hypothetical protein KBF47_11840, partial [Gemmatimonadales bacterium]|nr:hypothetical protein [Gemmatimonadales bacterium]